MSQRIVLHETYEEILHRAKPDPNGPHSSTAPKMKTAAMKAGWYSLRDGAGVLRGVVTTKGRGLRLIDVQLPDTLVQGLVGRMVSDVIDHPAIDGKQIIKATRKVEPKEPGSTDVFLSLPWFSIETRRSMVEGAGDLVDTRSNGVDRLGF